MGVAGGYIAAGLLQGLGKGLSQDYEERRQVSLAALKRSWDQEDAATAQADRIATLDHASELDTNKAVTVAKVAGEEQRLTRTQEQADRITLEGVKFGHDVSLTKLKAGLDKSNDAASKLLSAQIDAGQVNTTHIGDDGSLVVVYKDGHSEKNDSIKVHIPTGKEGDDEGGTIAAAQARQNGGKPAPKKGEVGSQDIPGEKGAALAALGNAYAKATQDPDAVRRQYPAMFRNGKLRPIGELKAEINSRYGS
jgi:hypothetical protein